MNKLYIGLVVALVGIVALVAFNKPEDQIGGEAVIDPTKEGSAKLLVTVDAEKLVSDIVQEMNTKGKPIQVLEDGMKPSDQTDALVTSLPKGARVDTYGDNGYIIVLPFADREEEHYYDTKKGFIEKRVWYYEQASTTP